MSKNKKAEVKKRKEKEQVGTGLREDLRLLRLQATNRQMTYNFNAMFRN